MIYGKSPPPGDPQRLPRRTDPHGRLWRIAGIVLAITVGVLGLVAVAVFIAIVVAVNGMGSNK